MTKQEVEFEIQKVEGHSPGIDEFHVHVRCFTVWDVERRLLDG